MYTPRPTLRIERETALSFNEEEETALIWSASPLFQRKMERLRIEPYETNKRDGQPVEETRSYRLPKAWIRVRLPLKLTEEQRKARSDQARERFSKPKAIPAQGQREDKETER